MSHKTNSTRILNRFKWWSVTDCDCAYCLYSDKGRPCSREVCCIADIKQEALRREQGVTIATNGAQTRKEAMPCPV